MASPNYDSLSIVHSKNIGDPVAAAATNGSRWSSAQRDNHLNEAIRRLLRLYVERALAKIATGLSIDKELVFLDPYVGEGAQSLTSNVAAFSGWTGTVAWILSAYNSTDTVPIKKLSDALRVWVLAGGNSFLTASATNQYWTRDGTNFRLVDGSTTSTDSITLRYIKEHAALSAGGASDIIVTSIYWDFVTDMAFIVAMEEFPTAENVQKGMLKYAAILKQINGGTEV